MGTPWSTSACWDGVPSAHRVHGHCLLTPAQIALLAPEDTRQDSAQSPETISGGMKREACGVP